MALNTCPKCGGTIDSEDPHGLCPACLIQQGLAAETIEGSGRQCVNCETALADDALFCARCGTAAPAFTGASDDPLRQALEAKLGGQYRILRLLGRGGMGAVYLARDLTLEREVAIKVVKPASDTRSMYDRFRREAKTAARLSHPNIVPLHAFGEVDGMPYFVMGYVRGESLADRLRRDGRLPEDDAKRVLAEIADALDHAHREGIVHRDVKPDNVLLEDASGRALLTDFGVAKAMNQGETLTQFGSVVGTPHYMSPEQASGRTDLDGRSDIYALGVVGYAMLGGRLPFEGQTAGDILRKHMTEEPAPLRSLAPMVSESTAHIVERCLAKDLASRWPDARSLKRALGAVEDSQLPDALQSIEGRGVPGLFLAGIWMMFVLFSDMPHGVKWMQAAVIAFIYVFIVNGPRKEGFSTGQVQRAIWREPSWWLWWYPRALRRPGNVLDRMPASVRTLRSWPLVVFLSPWIFFPMVIVTRTFPHYERNPGFFVATVAGFTAIVTISIVLIGHASRNLRARGLGRADIQRVMFSMPPSRASFWARPHIAAILSAAAVIETPVRSDSPHDQLQSILRNAEELSGPLRPLGTQAAAAARQLVASIEQSDKHIAKLVRNLEPGEEQRLAGKIEALGTSEESAPLRALLEKQLELIGGLAARIEEAKASRNRHVEMIKTLALHLASLRTRLGEAPSEVRSLSDNVRALCEDIGEQEMRVQLADMPTIDRRA